MAESKARAALTAALARAGTTFEDLPRNTRLGRAVRKHGVACSNEFERIDALPRREWHNSEYLADTVSALTAELRTPRGQHTLFPVQAVALIEGAEHKGGAYGIRTGGGKTWPSFLIATLVDARRPVLFVPAKLREKTEHDLQAARVHWRVPDALQIMSYEDLSQVSFCDWLMNYQPDCFSGDEAHKLKADDSARALRVERFHDAFPGVPFFLWSGTFLRKNPRDAAKLFEWALGDKSPLPRHWKEIEDWCSALDPRARVPMAPGALLRWLEPGADETPEEVRLGVGRRIVQTPGIVMSHGKGVDCGLQLQVTVVQHEACEPYMRQLKTLDEAPDGWILNEAIQKWQLEQTLALGYWNEPKPRPPEPWANARREWNALARELIKDKRTTIDSDLQAWNACEAADTQPEIWRTWRDIKDTFALTTEPVWFSDYMIERAAEWLLKHSGVVWVQHVPFGERLSALSGVPYYRENACDAFGASIVHAKAGPAIASIEACGEGFNLQDRWHRCLYVIPSSNGKDWEQSLARFHRLGQKSTEVLADVLVSCRVSWDNLQKAIEAEKAVSQLTLDDQRKLAIADILQPRTVDVLSHGGFRWAR